jgi:hypothetical protein
LLMADLYGVRSLSGSARRRPSLMECDWPQTSSFVIRHIIPSSRRVYVSAITLPHKIWCTGGAIRPTHTHRKKKESGVTREGGDSCVCERKRRSPPKWPRLHYIITLRISSSYLSIRPSLLWWKGRCLYTTAYHTTAHQRATHPAL